MSPFCILDFRWRQPWFWSHGESTYLHISWCNTIYDQHCSQAFWMPLLFKHRWDPSLSISVWQTCTLIASIAYLDLLRNSITQSLEICQLCWTSMTPSHIPLCLCVMLIMPVHMQWRIQDFPEGGAWTLQGGREHAKFSRKLHEIERIWTPRGGRASLTPPPTRSANDMCVIAF